MTNSATAPFNVFGKSAILALLVIAGCVPSEYIADYGLQPGGAATLGSSPAPGELQSFVFEGARAVQFVRYEDERLAVDFTYDQSRGFWHRARPMFDLDVNRAQGRQDRNALAARALGSEFRLVLAFEIEGERFELELPARVVDVNVRASYY
jgi:hypothetical protein